MNVSKLTPFARPLVLVGAAALFVDLFFDWFKTTVTTPTVSLSTGSSGLSGWGIVVAVLAVSVLVWELTAPASMRKASVTLLLAAGALLFTVVQATTGKASIDAVIVDISTKRTLWPAYAGIVLAAGLAAGAIVALLEAWEPHTHAPPAAHTPA